MNNDSTRADSATRPEGGDTLRSTVLNAAITGAEPAEPALFHPGEVILDTYRVESEALQGGMGSVWRVHHRHWNVDLAMKRPQRRVFQTEAQKRDFAQECRCWIRLGLHPHIVSCYYVREIEGVPSIFSEWVEGGSLSEHIRDGSVYTGTDGQVQARLLDLSIQFARGLHFAHEQGLIHQDVKPDNLLVTSDWTAKVSDFGLARARSNLTVLEGDWTAWDAPSNATMVLPSGGCTPAYCSPEQAAGQVLTRGTDIYSWAVSVLELYLGRKPWAHSGALTGPLAGIACRDYFDMCPVTMPEGLCDLLETCLAQDPEERPRTFSGVLETLKGIYQSVTGQPYPRSVPAAAADTADSLNNRALSFLDLGEYDTAMDRWEQALRLAPGHAPSVFNRALARYRTELLTPCEVWEALMPIGDVHVQNRFHSVLDQEISKSVQLPVGRRHPFDEILSHSGDGRFITASPVFYQQGEAREEQYRGMEVVYDLDRKRYLLALAHLDFLHDHDNPQVRRSQLTLSQNGRFAAYELSRNRNGLDGPAGVWETHTAVVDLAALSHSRSWYLSYDAKELTAIPDGPNLREFPQSGGRLNPSGTVIAFSERGETLQSCTVSFYSVKTGARLSRAAGTVLLGFTRAGRPVLYTAEEQVRWGGTARSPMAKAALSIPCPGLDWRAETGSLFRQVNDRLAVVKQRAEEGRSTGLLFALETGRVISPLRWLHGPEYGVDDLDAFQMAADGRHLLYLAPGVFHAQAEVYHTITAEVWDSGSGAHLGWFFPAISKDPNRRESWRHKRNNEAVHRDKLLTCFADNSALRVLPELRADYLLSRISSTETRLAEKDRFEALVQQAKDALRQGDRLAALRLTDEARACPGFEADTQALRLRATAGARLQKRMVRQIIPLPQEPSTLLKLDYIPASGGPDWQSICASIARSVEDSWRPDGYYNEVRVSVVPSDFSADGRNRLLNILIAEDYTSPAQYDTEEPEDTRHTLGVAVAETGTGRILYRNKALWRYDASYHAPFQTEFFHTSLHVSGGELWLLSRGFGVYLRRVGMRDVFRVRKGRCQYAAFLQEERFLLLQADNWVWLYDLTGGGGLRQALPGQFPEDAAPGGWCEDAPAVDVQVKDAEGRYLTELEQGTVSLINDNCFSIRRGEQSQLCWLDWRYEGEA